VRNSILSEATFGYCEKMDKKDFRVLMMLMKHWLDKHYTDSAPAKSTVEKWFAKLKRDKMCIEGDARKKVHKIILNDRKLKLIEIAGTLKISKKYVEHIVH
jgi:hypothetical protein